MSTKLQALRKQELSPEVWRELVYATLLQLPHSATLRNLWSFTIQEQWEVLERAQLLPSGPTFTPKNLRFDTLNESNLVFHKSAWCLSCGLCSHVELGTTQYLHWGCSGCRNVPQAYELQHSVFFQSVPYWLNDYHYKLVDRLLIKYHPYL